MLMKYRLKSSPGHNKLTHVIPEDAGLSRIGVVVVKSHDIHSVLVVRLRLHHFTVHSKSVEAMVICCLLDSTVKCCWSSGLMHQLTNGQS